MSPRPARASTKIRVVTNWFAEAEHGGLYHAVEAGLYAKAGLDVELKQGGPQLNTMQLLIGGEADIIMSYDIQIMTAFEKGVPVKAIFTCFQFDLIGLLTRPDVNSLADLKGRKVYFGSSGYSTYWPWLKKKYGYTDDMAGPKGPNLQTFLVDPTSAVAGYITSEPYVAEKQKLATKFFLFANEGYPSYSNTMAAKTDFIKHNTDAVARFTKASIEGWKAYMADPSAGNALIKRMNPKMDDAQIEFTLRKMREVKAIESGTLPHGRRHHHRGALEEDPRLPGRGRASQGRDRLPAVDDDRVHQGCEDHDLTRARVRPGTSPQSHRSAPARNRRRSRPFPETSGR